MELNKYQEQAMTTYTESSNNLAYMLYNLMGEVGEAMSYIVFLSNANPDEKLLVATECLLALFGEKSKIIRKNPELDDVKKIIKGLNKNSILQNANEVDIALLQKECGDILWQLAGLCSVMGWKLDDIAQQNLDKLASRQERGKIVGNGDNR